MSDPRFLDGWAERLAAAAAPDEIDIAPETVAAYAAGGAARRQLFAGTRADPGAFGGGLVLMLPVILDALAQSAVTVRAFLADPAVSASIATASLLVAVRQLRRSGRAAGTSAQEASPAEGTAPATEPPPEVVERAGTAVTDLEARLAESVAAADRAEAIAREVLTAMANDPRGAVQFLDLLRGGRR